MRRCNDLSSDGCASCPFSDRPSSAELSSFQKEVVWRTVRDLNISYGRIDGGGVNADITDQAWLPNFIMVADGHLSFSVGQ